jgi:hypothetical protein
MFETLDLIPNTEERRSTLGNFLNKDDFRTWVNSAGPSCKKLGDQASRNLFLVFWRLRNSWV